MNIDEADTHFAAWMRENLDVAASHFNLEITARPIFGWRLRSISARAHGNQGSRWLRVVSQDPQWAQGDPWTGTLDANSIVDVPKPRVLEVLEWADGRQQRAEVMTLLPGWACSPTDALRSPLALPRTWWSDLKNSLEFLAGTSTDRTNSNQQQVTQRIQDRFGNAVDTAVFRWETVHGDLHWSNLMHSPCGLLDWELWGRGPAGTDAATLYCYSLLVPTAAEKVHEVFADALDTPTGRVAQLYVIARMLRRVDDGDYPDLAEPLARHAHGLLLS
ncbi:MAG: aminoglycoside phosphotransferase [Pseudonocardiales bacterium]|nr:aminoglycoside phosphotransferase family protein [Actinomycetota bacterium]PZS15507.1 MAG: aminoglycoside phosphotransferase [Pseudonocardiales bacterium]